MSLVISREWRDARKMLRTLIGAGCLLCGPSAVAQHAIRSLTGTVTDGHHEPLKGAVVQVHDEGTDAVMSYITDRTGTYSFKRLDPDVDYGVWAMFRSRRSATKEISRFDSHPHKVINLIIKTR
jgi:hypothetical protein